MMSVVHYVVIEKLKHRTTERVVYGHSVKAVVDDEQKSRTKQWGHLCTFRVAEMREVPAPKA